jgi:hypothetical protein
MLFHVHAATAEAHAFGFQAESLLDSVITGKLDFAARPEHSLPGKSE